ncbi:MAG: hypothetical protein IKE23_11845 [Exiguobacterium sp.]|nr:hypothetical protein [Exiguobacterium sp.]
MADLATAYLRLIPSLKGAQKQIESELGGVNTKSTGDKLGGGLGEGIRGGLGKIAIGNFLGNILTQGVDMAVNAAVGTFQNAFENIGLFEQLSGGVEKIFDQANTEQIFKDAQNAYKDLNMSANEYLDSINQVGATFAQTMGDQKGYDTARQGMLAIADYASGTGRNLDELNEKYKLITRSASGYQSIADQFAGILPQTSKDFLEQAQQAGYLSTQYKQLTDVLVAEYQQAVTQMLEKGVSDLGLLGNTAAESTGTLTGSIAMLQSSWQNLLTSFGNGGDIDASIQAVVDSIGAVMQNAIPVVEQILAGMGKAIGDFAMRAGEYFMEHRTEVYDKVGEFIKAALEAIVTAIPYIIEGIAYLVASLIEYVVTHIPDMLNAAGQLMLAFLQAIADAWGPAMTAINNIGQGILDAIGGFFQSMFDAGANIIQSLINGILSGFKPLGDALASVGDFIVSHKGPPSYDKVMLRDNAKLIMGGLTETIIAEIPSLDRAMQMVNGAISVDADISPASTNSATTTPGAPIVNVYFNDEESVDDYERGRRIGAAAAYELRMQGVCA